jgi:hypothetical protein
VEILELGDVDLLDKQAVDVVAQRFELALILLAAGDLSRNRAAAIRTGLAGDPATARLSRPLTSAFRFGNR